MEPHGRTFSHLTNIGSLQDFWAWLPWPPAEAQIANQASTAQQSTAQHSTAQNSTAQHSTAQHSTAPHSTAQHITAERRTARTSTAQHSTALQSTAQHSTAQHITAQCSTAQHSARPHLRNAFPPKSLGRPRPSTYTERVPTQECGTPAPVHIHGTRSHPRVRDAGARARAGL